MVQPISHRNLSAEQMDFCRRAGISFTPEGQLPKLSDVKNRQRTIAVFIIAYCFLTFLLLDELYESIFYFNTYLNFNDAVAWACFSVVLATVAFGFTRIMMLNCGLYKEAELQIREIKTRNVVQSKTTGRTAAGQDAYRASSSFKG